jgi:hypothetical protein
MCIVWGLSIGLSSLFGMESQVLLAWRDRGFGSPDVLFEAYSPEIEPRFLGGMRREEEGMRHSPDFGRRSPLFAWHSLLCA